MLSIASCQVKCKHVANNCSVLMVARYVQHHCAVIQTEMATSTLLSHSSDMSNLWPHIQYFPVFMCTILNTMKQYQLIMPKFINAIQKS